MRIKQPLKNGLFHVSRWSGLMPAVRATFAARGVILMFHEIHPNPSDELMTVTAPALLRYAICWFKKHCWAIVSLDEFLSRMTVQASSPRFAAFTFDDGYRDLVTQALPILEENNVPFTVFVPTGAPTRNLYSWWLGLRELVRTHDKVTIEAMGRQFQCQTFQEKVAAVREVLKWVSQDYHRKSMLEPTFASARISFSALNDAYFLSERELFELAEHPLASIGAHTSSHSALATLEIEAARKEMAENRAYLEKLLRRPIGHIAFPYGNALACGAREARLAAELGFCSGLTSNKGQFLAGRSYNPYFLPRVGVHSEDTYTTLEIQLSGFQRALRMIQLKSAGD